MSTKAIRLTNSSNGLPLLVFVCHIQFITVYKLSEGNVTCLRIFDKDLYVEETLEQVEAML